jgi:hypothetical protein
MPNITTNCDCAVGWNELKSGFLFVVVTSGNFYMLFIGLLLHMNIERACKQMTSSKN